MPYLTAPEELGRLLPDEPPFRARQLLDWLYRRPVMDIASMTNLPTAVRDRLAGSLWPFEVVSEQTGDKGRTVKWLFHAPDGAAVETVLMGYARRVTLCVSSQAGCAMGCTFCATGQFGFERHLSAGEIVAQVAFARAHLAANPLPRSPRRITNVVFMGMGEPLANYDNTREALRRIIDVMGMSARNITVSTVGVVPGIRRLAAEPWPVNLALSLHAADDATRNAIIPLARRYEMDALIEAAALFRAARGRRVSLEWALMADVNDTSDQARRLAAVARELDAHVNVIPLNATPNSPQRPPGDDRVSRFVREVRRHGANVTRRDTRGADIDAACGQLRAREEAIGDPT